MATEEEEVIDSIKNRLDVFGNSDTHFKEEILEPLGFKSEKDLLLNLNKLNREQLLKVINYTIEEFDYDEEELGRIVMYMFRGVFP